MSTNYVSFSETEQQPNPAHIPSRFDLNTGDTKASELLNDIITDCGPKSWYYFLEHILTSKPSDLSSSNQSPLHHPSNRFCYSFETFNKFFEIFKSSKSITHCKYINENNTFYIQIWLLHAQSHIIDFQTKPKHSKSRSFKEQKLKKISAIYKELFKHRIGVLCSEFYIAWAKYYVLRKKYAKAKNKIKIGIKLQATPIRSLNEFYFKLTSDKCKAYTNELECFSYSDLSTSSDSDLPSNTDTESENDDENANDENTAPTRYTLLEPPRRLKLTHEEAKTNENDDANISDSNDFDDEEDDDEFLKNYSHQFGQKKLPMITENAILSPKEDKKRGLSVRTPFAAIHNTEKSSNATATNTHNGSIKFGGNRSMQKPFTPNTLLRNMANNKPFSFTNRSRTSKPSHTLRKEHDTNKSTASPKLKTISFEPDTKSKSPFIDPRHQRKSRRESEPISPSWNNPMQSKRSKSSSERASLAMKRPSQSQSPSKYSPFKPQPPQPQQQSNNHPRKKRKTSPQQRAQNVNMNTKPHHKGTPYRNNHVQNGNKYRGNHVKPRHQMNMMTVNDRKMMQLKCIGRGGSAKVYKVITKDTFEILALKKITVQNSVDVSDGDGYGKDPMESFLNEIELLKKLKHKNHCIQMIDYEIIEDVRNNSKEIRMLFECGEIDLAHLLKNQKNGYFDKVTFIACYWHQMLLAVDTVHGFRIVHGDLKPANFLLVQGELKLIDFGIAKQIMSNETTRIARDSQIGTLNYICPEALISSNNNTNCYKLGRSADVWSLGCILHQMAFGFTPFTHLKFAAKLQAIVNPSCNINIKTHTNQYINAIVKQCLIREPKKRISIEELLKHAFLI